MRTGGNSRHHARHQREYMARKRAASATQVAQAHARWNHNAYVRRVSDGRCGRCGINLPGGYQYKTCTECREESRQYCGLWRKEKAAEADETLSTSQETSPELRGCKRCGLRGDHECLAGDAQDRKAWL